MCCAMYSRWLGNDFRALVSKGESGGSRHIQPNDAYVSVDTTHTQIVIVNSAPIRQLKQVWVCGVLPIKQWEVSQCGPSVCVELWLPQQADQVSHTQLPPRHCPAENRLLFPWFTVIKLWGQCSKAFGLSRVKSSRNYPCVPSN